MRSDKKAKHTIGGLILTTALVLLVCVCVLLANPGDKPGTPSVSGDSATTGSDVTVTDRISDRSDDPSVRTDPAVTDTDTDASGSDPTPTDTGHKTESTSTKTKPKTDTGTKTSTKTGTTDKPTDTVTDTDTDPGTNTDSGVKKRVAITFDDGPYTLGKDIADEIAKYNGHVTFFVVGNRISGKWKDAMVYAYQKGNEIAIHAYTHDFKYTADPDAYEEEIAKTAAVIKDAIGVAPTLFRPVGGAIPKDRIGTCGYPVIHWAVDSEDWKHKKPEGSREKIDVIVNNVMKNVEDGDIILFHEIYRNSFDAFCTCLKQLSAQGYEFVTVTELLNDPPAGKIYYRAG